MMEAWPSLLSTTMAWSRSWNVSDRWCGRPMITITWWSVLPATWVSRLLQPKYYAVNCRLSNAEKVYEATLNLSLHQNLSEQMSAL